MEEVGDSPGPGGGHVYVGVNGFVGRDGRRWRGGGSGFCHAGHGARGAQCDDGGGGGRRREPRSRAVWGPDLAFVFHFLYIEIRRSRFVAPLNSFLFYIVE